jgi:hypothetical protein
MKKLLFLATIGLTTLYGGVWTSVSGFGTKEINPDITYTLDTIGENPRVYEFTPRQNQDYLCVVVYTEGDYKSPVMQCFPKGKGRKE